MRIKKYIAPTMREALDRMRRELGEEVSILSSRIITTENGDSATEVVAGIEPHDLQQHRQSRVQPPVEIRQAAGEHLPHLSRHPGGTKAAVNATSTPQQTQQKGPEVIQTRHASALFASAETPTQTTSSKPETFSTTSSLLQLQHEMAEMRGMMSELLQNTRYKFSGTLPPAYRKAYQSLRDAAFSEEQAMYYIGRLAAQSLGADEESLNEELRNLITRDIRFVPALRKSNTRSVAAFVGATGAGKTTSLVKLAISYKLAFNADVMIISADTYKVGGMEQLQTFAMIANIPYRCVHSPAELEEILASETKRDFIFIDTVGRSHTDLAHLHDLQMYISAVQPDYTFVTLPATMNERTFMAAAESYMHLEPTGLILTKMDECSALGDIIPTLRKYPLPLAYFACGQRIPDDIEYATPESFMEYLLPALFRDDMTLLMKNENLMELA